jgi:hypothetical protein
MDLKKSRKYIVDKTNTDAIYKPKQKFMFGKLPGARYTSQYYMHNCIYDPKFMEYVGDHFIELLKEEGIDLNEVQLCAPAWSGLSILGSLQMYLNLKHDIQINGFMIREERKYYGRNNFEEGIPNKKPVLLVNDVGNSTGGLHRCKVVCEKQLDLEVLGVAFTIVNKYGEKSSGSYKNDRGSGQKLISVITRDDRL